MSTAVEGSTEAITATLARWAAGLRYEGLSEGATRNYSLPHVIAAAIVDRQVTPKQFTQDRIMDEEIRAQLNKVEVVADDKIEAVFPELQRVHVTVFTIDGRELGSQLDYPKGDPRNPLSDDEITEKFTALAEPIMTADPRQQLVDAVWRLDELDAVTGLMGLTRADR